LLVICQWFFKNRRADARPFAFICQGFAAGEGRYILWILCLLSQVARAAFLVRFVHLVAIVRGWLMWATKRHKGTRNGGDGAVDG